MKKVLLNIDRLGKLILIKNNGYNPIIVEVWKEDLTCIYREEFRIEETALNVYNKIQDSIGKRFVELEIKQTDLWS